MTAARVDALVSELQALGCRLWEDDGQLRFRAPRGVLTEQRRELMREHKLAIIEYLRGAGRVVADPRDRHEPFPLTDVQGAYLVGRGAHFPFGGVACHGYGELAFPELDPERLEDALNLLIERHDMLRAVVHPGGSQRVLPEVPRYRIPVTDVRGRPPEEAADAAAAVRAELDHRAYRTDRWPLFGAHLTRCDGEDLLHFSIDFLICDFVSIQVLLGELWQAYRRQPLPPLALTFRDYLLAERRARSDRQARDREHWLSRVDSLPAAPDLPRRDGDDHPPPRFRRWQTTLGPDEWRAFRARAGSYGVSPACAVLSAYGEVIGRWARRPRFALDVTLLDRQPLDPDVNRLIGDFTSVTVLAVDTSPGASFGDRAAAVQAQLWADLDHRTFSGVEVLRELGRRRGADAALMPVVFTSAIGLGDDGGARAGEFRNGISQTPQVWIDCQNIERGGGLATNWDVRDGVFPDGVVDDMFAAFERLLRDLAAGDDAWHARSPVPLPAAQAERRRLVNDTAGPLPDALLHDGLVAAAGRAPERTAVVAGGQAWTYGDLLARGRSVAAALRERGCRPGDVVAVVMDKGAEQVAGVLGVLLAGGVYLPVDSGQPPARRDAMLAAAGSRLVLTQSWVDTAPHEAIAVDLLVPSAEPVEPVTRSSDDLAYVIFTSGSTGVPKGVMISHRGAVNTIADINRRFAVSAADSVLGLANLGFDLSVWDIFGVLGAGGRLVLPEPRQHGAPSHWAELVAAHGVTLWNTVPAQFQMLVNYLRSAAGPRLDGLRLAMLSGDWIPVTLPAEARDLVPGLRVVSLGGATEGSIWSIWYPTEEDRPGWHSVPYGWPLTNQSFHVLDPSLRPCPDWVAGELYIGGAGVALGYLGDERKTADRFVELPDGQRAYRTGDLGRYRGDVIEFLGREDNQVKILGHRIELAEVEHALLDHPGVGAAVALVQGQPPLDRRLVAVVEPARRAAPEDLPARDLTAAAVAAGDAVLDGWDLAAYVDYTERLDTVALVSVMAMLREAGLPAERGDRLTLDGIVTGLSVAPRYVRLVRRWLGALAAEGFLEPLDGDGGRYEVLRPVAAGEPDAAWREIEARAPGSEADLVAYFRASAAHLPALLRGDADPVRLLFPEGRLDVTTNLYEEALFNRWANRAAARTVRRLVDGLVDGLVDRTGDGPVRILEIGAGNGGTTAAVLDALAGVEVDYLCTDLSGFFLNAARQRFGTRPGLRYARYDIDRDPVEQGVARPQTVDLVIAGDVLHASADVERALARLAELLAPGGWLVALEMTRDHYQIMTSLELLVRFAEGEDDFADVRAGRDQTFLSRDRWLDLVERAGGRTAVCVPEAGAPMAALGMHVFAARFKDHLHRLSPAGLADHLAGRLPAAMVPGQLVVADALPLTANAKVDRTAVTRWLERFRPARTEDAADPVPVPASAGGWADGTAARVAALWVDVLKVERVAPGDDFFALGGDSLLAAQLVGRILEEVPEAGGLFFDEALQLMLEARTVEGFTAGLAAPTAAPADVPRETADAVDAAPGLVALAGAPGGGDAWVLVPAADGSFAGYDGLVGALGASGPVAGLTCAEPLDLDALATRHVEALRKAEVSPYLIGTGPGAPAAWETARQLAESGTPPRGLALIDPPPDGHYDPEPYLGDLTLVCAAPDRQWQEARWIEACLGTVTVVAVPAGAERPQWTDAAVAAVAGGAPA